MLQFYFLSIVLNALAGYLLFTGDDNNVLELKEGFSMKDETFKLVVGILTAVTGLLKLLSPVEGDIPVIGDIVPAVVGLLAGFLLIFGYYQNRSSIELSEHAEKIDRVLGKNKKIIGVIALIVAALHFLFPKVLLL
ncbi:MAG: hypothetical protein FWF26_04120 [Treponema sp.]|nr:hypothetical protein [Treponema sp.]